MKQATRPPLLHRARRAEFLLRAMGVAQQGGLPYIYPMSPNTRRLLEQVETWPQEDQEELAEYAREIEARRTGVYIMSDDERAAVRRGLAQADQGEFIPDDVVSKADTRHRQ